MLRSIFLFFTTSESENEINPYAISTVSTIKLERKPSKIKLVINFAISWAYRRMLAINTVVLKYVAFFGAISAKQPKILNSQSTPKDKKTVLPKSSQFDLWICGVSQSITAADLCSFKRAWESEVKIPHQEQGFAKPFEFKMIQNHLPNKIAAIMERNFIRSKPIESTESMRRVDFPSLLLISKYSKHMILMNQTRNPLEVPKSMFLSVLFESIPTDLTEEFIRHLKIEIRQGKQSGIVYQLVFVCQNDLASFAKLQSLSKNLGLSFGGEDAELVLVDSVEQLESKYNLGFKVMFKKYRKGIPSQSV
jgi:hypothetical protein